MANTTPWKLALIGAVPAVAGFAPLSVGWPLPQIATFVAMLFVARGALHIMTMSLEGIYGALDALHGAGRSVRRFDGVGLAFADTLGVRGRGRRLGRHP